MRLQKIAIDGVVRVAEKGPLATVPTLRDMMGNPRNDETSETGHGRTIARIKCTVTVIPIDRPPASDA